MNVVTRCFLLGVGLLSAWATAVALPDEPKQTPANTIAVHAAAIKPQAFPRRLRFYINSVVDRTGNPQPLLVYAERGGIFLDREPTEIVRQALEESLRSGDLLAVDAGTAEYLLDVYLFHFGLSSGSGFEFFAKVELNVVIQDPVSGRSATVNALGTSIQNRAVRKTKIQEHITENMEEALQDAVRNFLRGVKLREAVASLGPAPAASPVAQKEQLLIVVTEPQVSQSGQTVDVTASPLEVRGIVMSPTGKAIPQIAINGKPAIIKQRNENAIEFWSDPMNLEPGESAVTVSAQTQGAKRVDFVFTVRLLTNPLASSKALTRAEIIKLLRGDVPSVRVAELVKERGISFAPKDDDLREIRAAGGQQQLIELLKEKGPR